MTKADAEKKHRRRDHIPLALSAEIRPCVRGDLPGLEWFGQFTPHRRVIRDAFRRHERGETIMLVVDFRGAPIGQVWLDVPKPKSPTIGSLWALRVFPWFQGLGIGRRLMHAGERLLQEHGARCIELNVDRGNAEVLRFYEHLGYQITGSFADTFNYRSPSGLQRAVQLDQWVMSKWWPDPDQAGPEPGRGVASRKS